MFGQMPEWPRLPRIRGFGPLPGRWPEASGSSLDCSVPTPPVQQPSHGHLERTSKKVGN
jgi:hypothetical protein